jgi:carbon monoxide dehydrogenase subunit G
VRMRTTVAVDVRVEIARPRSEVWSFLLLQPERMPDYLGEFESAELESGTPGKVGAVVRFTVSPGHRSGALELVSVDPERRCAWDGPPLRWLGGAMRARGSAELIDAGSDSTLLTWRFRPELSGAQVLLRPYLKRWLRRQRLADAQKLKQLIESEAGR